MNKCLGILVLSAAVLLLNYTLYERVAALSASSSHAPELMAKSMPVPPLLTCSPDRPVVSPNALIALRAWVASHTGEPNETALQYRWTVTAGAVTSQAAVTQWSFQDVRPGMYAAMVRVIDSKGGVAECSLQVIVEPREPAEVSDEVRRGQLRESGRAFLLPRESEKSGFGLYSYVLFGSPPGEVERERFLKIIEAYLQLVPDLSRLEKYFPPSELNVTYLPIDASPPALENFRALAEWCLQHYDYARARFLLRELPGSFRDGPYLVSALGPLSETSGPSGHLQQDLSSVPPHLAWSWVKEFLNQAAQEHFWEERTAAQLRLKIRTVIAVLATGLPEIQKALDQWIAWIS